MRVREIEVAGEEERPGKAGRLVDKGMAEADVALAIGGVAEMAEEDGLLGKLPPSGDLAKQIGERSIARRFEFIVGRLAGFGTGGERDDAGAVLTTVVLLLQEKRELGCAIDGAPRLEDEERHGTFMFDRIRHDLRMEL